jgi:hypothetical protein
LLLVLAGSRFADDASDSTPPRGEVELSGAVTTAAGGDPLLRATVHVYDAASGDTIATAFTDEQGRYETTVTGVGAEQAPSGAPTEYAVGSVYPNPLAARKAGRITLRYTTPGNRPAEPTLEVYDVLGRRANPGQALAAGVYFYRLRFEEKTTATRRFVLTEGGPVRFQLQQAQRSLEAAPDAPSASVAGKRAATDSVRIVTRKSGYVTAERTVRVAGSSEKQVDLALDAAEPPAAAFTVETKRPAGEPTIFTAGTAVEASEDDSTRFQWSFGDGQRAGGRKTAHVYTKGDTSYTVTMTAVGPYGAMDTTRKQIAVDAAPAPTGTATVRGLVTDAAGDSLSGVTVTPMSESISATTNDSGLVRLDVNAGVAVTLRAAKDGYAARRVRLELPEDAETGSFRATLAERDTTATIENVETGGMARGPDGVQVEVPVEGLRREDGTMATGDVDVGLTSVDVSDEDELGTFPGDFSGVTPEGEAELLMSYGVSEYDFTQNGADLDLAPGKTATIEIPVYVDEDLNGEPVQVGSEYPLWALNEETGDWVQEGTGTVVEAEDSPTGLVLRGEVSHFSWWNCDIAPDPYRPIPECKIRDENGRPTIDLDETCSIDGRLVGPGGPTSNPSANIPPGGGKPLPVPPDQDLVLQASAKNGTLVGEATVSGSAGQSEAITIPVSPIDRGGAGELIAPDTSFVAAIDTAGAVDRYTFEAEKGDIVDLAVEQSGDSDLEGTLSLLIKGGRQLGQQSFDYNEARLSRRVPKTGTYAIEVDGTENEPGGYRLSLTQPTTLQADTSLVAAIDTEGEVDRYTFHAPRDSFITVGAGPRAGSDLRGAVTLYDKDRRRIGQHTFGSGTDAENGKVAVEPQAAGFYIIEVTGEQAWTGEYTLSLSQQSDAKIQPDVHLVTSIDSESEVDRYTFSAEKDSLIQLSAKASPSSVLEGDVSLLTSDGELIERGSFEGGDYNLEFAEFAVLIPETGEYVIEVEGTRAEPDEYQLTLESSPVEFVSLNSNLSGTITSGAEKHYVFEADSSTVVRASTFGESGAFEYFRALNGGQAIDSRCCSEFGKVIPEDNQYLLTVAEGDGAFTTGLAEIEPPQALSFDANGRAALENTVDIYGDIQLYRLDASAGDGFTTELTEQGSEPLGSNLELDLYRQGSSNYADPEAHLRGDFYRARPAEEDSVLSALGAKLPGSGDNTYLIAVPTRSLDTPTGSYRLRAEYVPEATQLTADEDLTECPDADTRSVRAALLAAADNATVTACEGAYPSALEARIYSKGVTLAGTDREKVTVEGRGGSVMRLSASNISISDLMMVNTSPGDYKSTIIEGDESRNSTLERLTLRSGEPGAETAVRFYASRGAFRDLDVDSVQTAFKLRGDSLLIENNTLSVSYAGVSYEKGFSTVIRGNTIWNTISGGGSDYGITAEHTQFSDVGNVTIADNEVTLDMSGERYANGTGIVLEDDNSSTDTSRIAGNRVTILGDNQRGINTAPGSGVLIVENNRITANKGGATGFRVYGGSAKALIVRNNVIDNAGYEGINIRYVDDFDRTLIANNTLRSASSSSSSTFRSLILTASSGTTGALPITLVNNVFVGRSGKSVGVKVPDGTTIDSDYNLFYEYGTLYENGSTSTGSNDITGQDPLFTNDLLEVESGSPAVDAGASSSAYPGVPAASYDGTARPQGGGMDIGAHER